MEFHSHFGGEIQMGCRNNDIIVSLWQTITQIKTSSDPSMYLTHGSAAPIPTSYETFMYGDRERVYAVQMLGIHRDASAYFSLEVATSCVRAIHERFGDRRRITNSLSAKDWQSSLV